MKILEKCVTNKRSILTFASFGIVAALVAASAAMLVVLAQMPGAIIQEPVDDTHKRETISVRYTLSDMKFVPVSNTTEIQMIDAPVPDIISPGIIYPKPTNVPSLRQ